MYKWIGMLTVYFRAIQSLGNKDKNSSFQKV